MSPELLKSSLVAVGHGDVILQGVVTLQRQNLRPPEGLGIFVSLVNGHKSFQRRLGRRVKVRAYSHISEKDF